MTAYYSENDPHCVEWLRNLIREGLIADGEVDSRSVRDVRPIDLAGFDQCHFFAGIGLWSLALRWAGWPDSRRVWTGSCPCQPFSQAGARAGFDDERHLWPDWFWLIDQRRPDVIFGEQVESADGRLWLDLICTDLEARAYACGPAVFPSAGVGAPNMRHRFFWVADAGRASGRAEHQHQPGREVGRRAAEAVTERPGPGGDAGRLADTHGERRAEGRPDHAAAGNAVFGGGGTVRRMVDTGSDGQPARGDNYREHDRAVPGTAVPDGGVDISAGSRCHGSTNSGPDRSSEGAGETSKKRRPTGGVEPERSGVAGRLGNPGGARLADAEPRSAEGPGRRGEGRATEQSGGPRDPWRELEWIACLDGKRRPAQPGIFPLAPRHPGDVAKLRAYGNAINPVVAAEFVRAYMEAEWTRQP